ncbi:MAG: LSM domain-containing protein [Thermoplasmata archaeon]|uniref:Like-Sm ribonucleoprotein, eukaryotic and archaea-type, core n=1 Tax=uncultured organism TaxID=155900 RepID=M1PQY8_9ZZZZ|nr:like-Sm ribonucleoprotein, eukaryotic and archaea-type, core [uncultured organism]
MVIMKPSNFLNENLDTEVELLLKDGSILKGTLIGFDDHMNLVLEDTEEKKEDSRRRIGTIILRGNNVVTLNPK